MDKEKLIKAWKFWRIEYTTDAKTVCEVTGKKTVLRDYDYTIPLEDIIQNYEGEKFKLQWNTHELDLRIYNQIKIIDITEEEVTIFIDYAIKLSKEKPSFHQSYTFAGMDWSYHDTVTLAQTR